MIHCTPVEESERSFCRLGIAIATIVWSMKVIETAKIIAARISLLFLPPLSLMSAFDARRPIPPADGRSRWRKSPSPGVPIVSPPHASRLLDRPRNRRLRLPRRRHLRRPLAHDQPRTGAAMGAYLGVMLAFPLLAIGLATS